MLSLFDLAIAKAINGDGGGGGDITLETLNVSANGTTNAPSGTAYNKVVANVPNTYAAGDEGKVVSNGALVSQTAHATVTENGTIDTTLNNSVTVNLPVSTDVVFVGEATFTMPEQTSSAQTINVDMTLTAYNPHVAYSPRLCKLEYIGERPTAPETLALIEVWQLSAIHTNVNSYQIIYGAWGKAINTSGNLQYKSASGDMLTVAGLVQVNGIKKNTNKVAVDLKATNAKGYVVPGQWKLSIWALSGVE